MSTSDSKVDKCCFCTSKTNEKDSACGGGEILFAMHNGPSGFPPSAKGGPGGLGIMIIVLVGLLGLGPIRGKLPLLEDFRQNLNVLELYLTKASMVRTEEETRAPSVKEPASLLELCEEALRSRAATRSREVLDILELARFTHRTALEEACVRAIWRNFAMLRERHGPEELRAALGDARYEKFEAEFVDFLESKAEVARLRSGQVIELEPCADIEPDGQGNFPLEVLRTGAVWPSGVDPANREMRLHDETFQQLFKMDKAEFAKLPSFVRIREKRDHGLF